MRQCSALYALLRTAYTQKRDEEDERLFPLHFYSKTFDSCFNCEDQELGKISFTENGSWTVHQRSAELSNSAQFFCLMYSSIFSSTKGKFVSPRQTGLTEVSVCSSSRPSSFLTSSEISLSPFSLKILFGPIKPTFFLRSHTRSLAISRIENTSLRLEMGRVSLVSQSVSWEQP